MKSNTLEAYFVCVETELFNDSIVCNLNDLQTISLISELIEAHREANLPFNLTINPNIQMITEPSKNEKNTSVRKVQRTNTNSKNKSKRKK